MGWLVTGRVSSLGVNWNLEAAQAMLPSLMGHMIFGVVKGLTYVPLRRWLASRRPAAGRKRAEAEVVA